MFIESKEPRKLASRMAFLAYQAASVVGRGAFQAKEGVTEEQIQTLLTSTNLLRYDYLYGRRMKFDIRIEENGIMISDRILDPEYQSWCETYPTYQDLATAAYITLEIKEEDSVS